jgi:hypothetical protein
VSTRSVAHCPTDERTRSTTVCAWDVVDPGAYERRGVPGGQGARPEALAGAGRACQAVEPEAAPVMPGQVVADQIAAVAERDQPVGFDVAGRPLAAARRVGEAQPILVPAALRDGREQRGVDGRAGAPHRRDRRGPQRVDPRAKPRRHDLDDLGERTDRGSLDAGDGTLGRHPEPDRDGRDTPARAADRRHVAGYGATRRAGRPVRIPASGDGPGAGTAAAASALVLAISP